MKIEKTKLIYKITGLPFAILILTGCGTPIYKNPNLDDAKKKHRIVAILPFTLTDNCSVLARSLGTNQVDSLNYVVSFLFQKELYDQFTTRQQNGEYSIIFQDIEKTNILLEKSNIRIDSLNNINKIELAQILGVDATIATSIPCPKREWYCGGVGGLVFITAFIDALIPDKTILASMEIYNGYDAQLLWKYDYKSSGRISMSPGPLVSSLLKKISKKFPYRIRH